MFLCGSCPKGADHERRMQTRLKVAGELLVTLEEPNPPADERSVHPWWVRTNADVHVRHAAESRALGCMRSPTIGLFKLAMNERSWGRRRSCCDRSRDCERPDVVEVAVSGGNPGAGASIRVDVLGVAPHDIGGPGPSSTGVGRGHLWDPDVPDLVAGVCRRCSAAPGVSPLRTIAPGRWSLLGDSQKR
jgi:hypothetical protein